jgi:hypothetical protein
MESWINCVLLTGMELMDTTVCLGLYAKRRNSSSRGSPLLRISCMSYLGKHGAQDSLKYPMKLIITYSKPKTKLIISDFEILSAVNRKIRNIFCHTWPAGTSLNYVLILYAHSVYIMYSFLPMLSSFFSESASADCNIPRESCDGTLLSDLVNMQITNITLSESFFLLLCFQN